jgi:hypothetical protein
MAVSLYRGPWPQNVSKLAKYAVRFVDGEWKLTVLYDAGDGLRFLAVDGGGASVAKIVNAAKVAARDQPGGAFYVNEYRHIIVPVAAGPGSGVNSLYYFAGILDTELSFEFEGRKLHTKPLDTNGQPLKPGASWLGPRPGTPYVLAAGARDVYYETPALTDSDPPQVRPNMTQRVMLSRVLRDTQAAGRTAASVAAVRSHAGGRFYVNEHGAMFTPVNRSEVGIEYIYCGTIDLSCWFAEPRLSSGDRT